MAYFKLDVSIAAALAEWDETQDGMIARGALDRMRGHPAFFPAVKALMAKMLELNAGDPLQDSIRKDLGRYLCSVFTLYLDATGDLTLPRLKELCAQTKLLSPGRARAFLLYLRVIGYVRPAPAGGQERVRRYLPTEAMANAFRDHTRIGLEALALVEPRVRVVIDHLDTPAVFKAIVRQMGKGAIDSARLRNADPSLAWEVFVPRTGGMQVLYCLYEAALASEGDGGMRTIAPSISEISQRAGISRVQVLRLLRDAQSASLLMRAKHGQIELSAAFVEQVTEMMAINLVGRAVTALRGYEALLERPANS